MEIHENGFVGRAECRPYARYEETAESVIALIESLRQQVESGATNMELQYLLPAGAARNVLDCALWDLEAKTRSNPIWELHDIPAPQPRETALTLSVDTPQKMAEAALMAKGHTFLKMKIGAEGGLEACEAVIKARPDARLIVDANEALSLEDLEELCALEGRERIALIEQPLPASQDLPGLFDPEMRPILCADESLHTSDDLERLWAVGYRAVNVKLDKTGGLTEALILMQNAKAMGFQIMAGCMVGSSLAMAPMVVLESLADFIDLDGPLLLSDDYSPPLTYKGGKVFPPSKELWG